MADAAVAAAAHSLAKSPADCCCLIASHGPPAALHDTTDSRMGHKQAAGSHAGALPPAVVQRELLLYGLRAAARADAATACRSAGTGFRQASSQSKASAGTWQWPSLSRTAVGRQPSAATLDADSHSTAKWAGGRAATTAAKRASWLRRWLSPSAACTAVPPAATRPWTQWMELLWSAAELQVASRQSTQSRRQSARSLVTAPPAALSMAEASSIAPRALWSKSVRGPSMQVISKPSCQRR
mmetsp:Transcript_39620/g.112356  ORF Transcript_39620/g.112356 Transcript_39620/m.112356 type:complete len:241 (-) Transcript_39620:4211-4933(-)